MSEKKESVLVMLNYRADFWVFFFWNCADQKKVSSKFFRLGHDWRCFNGSLCFQKSSTEGVHMDNLLIFRSEFKLILHWDLNIESVRVCKIKYLLKYESYNEKPYIPTPRPRPILP